MVHHHRDSIEREGFFAANMMFVILAIVLMLILFVALITWQPWSRAGGGTEQDGSGGSGGGGTEQDESGGSGGGDSSALPAAHMLVLLPGAAFQFDFDAA